MAIQAVIWDLGGVLVRTQDAAPRTALAQRFGMTRSELERLVFSGASGDRAQLGEISYEHHLDALRLMFNLTNEQMQDFIAQFFGGDRVDTEQLDRIRALKQSYKIGLLSNAFSNLRQVVTEDWKFADLFDQMVISAEEGVVKPDPHIYHLTLERLGVAPQAAVFLDDFSRNAAGARAVGMHAIHFETPSQAWAELEQLLVDQSVSA